MNIKEIREHQRKAGEGERWFGDILVKVRSDGLTFGTPNIERSILDEKAKKLLAWLKELYES